MNRVRLWLIVDPFDAGWDCVSDFEDVLKQRPHLKDWKVTGDKVNKRVEIEVGTEILNKETAEVAMKEEMFEVANAVLADYTTMRVEIAK